MPERWTIVNGVLLLTAVQKQGTDHAVNHHGKAPDRALPALCEPAYSLPEFLAPAYLSANIFVLTGVIGGQGQGSMGVGWRRQT